MPFITVNAHSPADYGAAFAAENATIAGSVRLEKNSSVWYGAVLRADTGRITIGENSNVQDNAVLHTGPGLDVTIGRGVSIGHGAIVHGCTVGDNCLIGMHATILNGAVIGAGSLIAAGALVPERWSCPQAALSSACRERSCTRSVRRRPQESKQTRKSTWNWRSCTRKPRICRGRRPRRPAEGARPLSARQFQWALQGKTIVYGKAEGRACRPLPFNKPKEDAVNQTAPSLIFISAPHPGWRL